MKYLDSLFNIIAPHHCLNCQKEGSVCCQKCLEEIKDVSAGKICYVCNIVCPGGGICKLCQPKQNIDSINWYADYSDPLPSRLVKSLKFEDTYSSAECMAKALCSLDLNVSTTPITLVTSAPTAGKRARSRGWDQAKIIARNLTRYKKLPYKQLLIRTSSFDQIGSTKKERAEASKNFFKPHRAALIKDSVIILVDDVVTTGSTLNAAANVLKSAGAKEVHGLVFARQGLK